MSIPIIDLHITRKIVSINNQLITIEYMHSKSIPNLTRVLFFYLLWVLCMLFCFYNAKFECKLHWSTKHITPICIRRGQWAHLTCQVKIWEELWLSLMIIIWRKSNIVLYNMTTGKCWVYLRWGWENIVSVEVDGTFLDRLFCNIKTIDLYANGSKNFCCANLKWNVDIMYPTLI